MDNAPQEIKKRAEYYKTYRRKQRYASKIEKILKEQILCNRCKELAETLHHKNENHFDNRNENLEPLCRKCHLETPHTCDRSYYYPENRPNRFKLPVHILNSTKDLIENCEHLKIYNKTIYNPTTYVKINIIICSKKTLGLLLTLGFTDLIKQND